VSKPTISDALDRLYEAIDAEIARRAPDPLAMSHLEFYRVHARADRSRAWLASVATYVIRQTIAEEEGT